MPIQIKQITKLVKGSRILKLRGVLLFLNVVTLLYTFFPNGIKSQYFYGQISLFETATEVRNILGGTDGGQLLEVSVTIANGQELSPESQHWIPRTWSIGQSIVQVPLILLQKFNIPFSLSYIFTCFIVWVTLHGVVYSLLKSQIKFLLSWSIAWNIFMFSWDANYLFQNGVYNSETLGIGVFLIALLLMSSLVLRGNFNVIFLLLISSLLSISMLIRYPFEFAVGSILGVSVLRVSLRSFRFKRNGMCWKLALRMSVDKFRIPIYTTSISLLLTVPYRIWTRVSFDQTNFSLSSASTVMTAPNLWSKASSPHAQYWDSTGMNWACDIDPIKCNLIQLSEITVSEAVIEATKSALLNFPEYLSHRVTYASSNWIPYSQDLYSLIGSLQFIGLFLVFVALMFRFDKKVELLTIWIAPIFVQIGSFTILHFESRYFIPLRLLCLFFTVLVLQQIVAYSKNYKNPLEIPKWSPVKGAPRA